MANDKWSGSNPWLGLAPYTEGTPLHGRTQESALLSEIIKDNIVTIVYGKSGIGKSSLLSAGISPILRKEQYIPVPLRLVHNTEVSYVEQIENRVRELIDCKDELPENVPNLGLWDFFHRNTFTKDGTFCQPVIILDQFEEIYTLTDVEHKPEIIALFTELASLLNDIKPDAVLAAESSFTEKTTTATSSDGDFSFELSTESSFAYNETVSFRFVICLREDKLYLLERNSANIPSIKTNRYNLQALSPDSALEVITCPRPELFTTEEATAIVDKLSDMGDEGIRTIDPAILSLFLYKYFEKKGEANYDNIFADYYREATRVIKDKSLAFLEDYLLTLGGYRNQIPIDDALSSGVSQSEIDSLIKQIILRSEKRKGIDYIEFSHDRLCAEAKQSRDERAIRTQRQKLFVRTLCGFLIVVVITVLSVAVVLKINKAKEEAEAAQRISEQKNEQLQAAYHLLQDREREKDSINSALESLFLLNQLQRDSLFSSNIQIRKTNSLLSLIRDSLYKNNKELYKTKEMFKALNQMALIKNISNIKIEESNPLFQNDIYEVVTKDTPHSFNDVYEFFVQVRDLFCQNEFSPLSRLSTYFQNYNLHIYQGLKVIKGEIVSLDGHYIFNEEFMQLCSEGSKYANADKLNNKANLLGSRGQISVNSILYKNFCIKGNSSLTLSFPARGYEEIGVITEPGGAVSLRAHITNKDGLDKWYSTTNNFTKGEPYRRIQFDIPTDVRNIVEIEIINCTNKDVSFVILSN